MFQNVGTHTRETTQENGEPEESFGIDIKESVVTHLKDLGITENFSKLLLQFALDKEYSEYINFLRNVAVVPEEEGENGGAAPQGH